jgi:hypothetical protein
MLTQGTAYEDPGENAYEQQYQQRARKNLRQKAQKMGMVYADTREAVMD